MTVFRNKIPKQKLGETNPKIEQAAFFELIHVWNVM